MKLPTKPLVNCEATISWGSIQIKGGIVEYDKPSFVVCSKELPKFRNELTMDEMREFLKMQLPEVDEKDIERLFFKDRYSFEFDLSGGEKK